ncbi:hypothetical protein [Pedobacter sp.]|uniref:hypothetical protein n=1 Tax=Pedobacter sp. TaxID=1411316 RepID=UPI003D7FA0B1
MKSIITFLFLSVVFLGCQSNKTEVTYVPKVITDNTDFNFHSEETDVKLSIIKYSLPEKATANEDETFGIKFGDTTVRIRLDNKDPESAHKAFSFAKFINTQKTAMLVQIADNSGLVAPFFIVAVKDGQLQVHRLYRASTGKLDKEITRGVKAVGSSGHLVNNDYFVTNVNAKVYLIKRQNPEERIQGDFFIQSSNRQTLVFLVPSAFYQVHYPTGENFTQALPASLPMVNAAIYKWVQATCSWVENTNGISFLKSDSGDNRIRNLNEFRD